MFELSKPAILRYESQGALFHYDFSTRKISLESTQEVFQDAATLEQTVSTLARAGVEIPSGVGLRKIHNLPVPGAYSAPLKLFLDVSNFCNLSCSHCLSSSSVAKSDTLSFETIEDIANQAEQVGVFYVKLGGGEPMLYPRIVDLIDMLNSHALDVSVTTNGTMMTPELAQALHHKRVKTSVSIDGTQQTHDQIRGRGNYAKAVRALYLLKEQGADVILRTTLFPSNIGDIPYLVELAEQQDVMLKIRRAKPSGRATDNNMIMTTPTPEYFNLIAYLNERSERVDIEDIMNTNPDFKKDLLVSSSDCAAGTRSIHIDQNGNVSPCVFLGPSFIAGSIYKESLMEIWRRKQAFKTMRNLALHEDCKGCQREGTCHNECPAIKMYATGSLTGKDPGCLSSLLKIKL